MQKEALPHAPQKIGHVLIDLELVKQKLGLESDSAVYSWIRSRGFPRPLKGSRKHARWILQEVDSFIEQLPRGAVGENPAGKKVA